MKLISYKDFCKMPAGTVFAPYTPCILEERLAIKVDAGKVNNALNEHRFNGVMPLEPWLGDDCLLWNIGDQDEASFEVYDGDNNSYYEYEMFLVFEETDIDKMINVLKWAKNGCVGDLDD